MSAQRVIVITGAGSGVGKVTAKVCWDAGYGVVLVGRRAEMLEQTIAEAGVSPELALAVPCDVSDPAAVAALFEQAVARFGRVDVLFNNAGVGQSAAGLEDLSIDEWRRVIDIDLTGVFLCTQAAFRVMKQQTPRGGRIINNGSISAQRPRPKSIAYTAAKHGVNGLTKSTSLEGRPYDIACGQIDIGNAATEMTERMGKGVPQADGTMRAEPRIDSRYVAQAVLYMADLPLDVNVPFMTVMANQMPFLGRG